MNISCVGKDCSGCTSCASSCSKHAITMRLNSEGFWYPSINQKLCVNCGLCSKVCPSLGEFQKHVPKTVYLSWIKDTETRLNSSSGGIFSAIAKKVLSKDGVVCGAAYDEHMNVHHTIIDSIDDLPKLMGSKYVQSTIGDVFSKIKKFLQENRFVYFVGTPCQVQGLKSYLRKQYPNLVTSDLICHGNPSGELFKAQIKCLEKKNNYKVKDFKFRSKDRFGQGCDIKVITDKDKAFYYNAELLPYFNGFWKNLTLRESCYNCNFSSIERVGDITLGDYWLVKKVFPGTKTSKGCSLIFVNSDIGNQVVNEISSDIFLRQSSLEQAMLGQGQLKKPVPRPKARDLFNSYENFEQLSNGLLATSLNYKIKMRLRNLIKTIILFKYWK